MTTADGTLPIEDDDAEGRAGTEGEKQFASLEAFVAGYLSPLLARKATPRRVWCSKWWAHPEAVLRLWSLWQAWEVFFAEGGAGPSSWWVYHLDHHLMVLFDGEAGPFALCRDGHTNAAQPLPTDPAPAGAGPIIVGERSKDQGDAVVDPQPPGPTATGAPPVTPAAYAGGEEDRRWTERATIRPDRGG
ncbi:MAG: DUF4913 domain-containing protein [Acidimicrobiales bacterium]